MPGNQVYTNTTIESKMTVLDSESGNKYINAFVISCMVFPYDSLSSLCIHMCTISVGAICSRRHRSSRAAPVAAGLASHFRATIVRLRNQLVRAWKNMNIYSYNQNIISKNAIISWYH